MMRHFQSEDPHLIPVYTWNGSVVFKHVNAVCGVVVQDHKYGSIMNHGIMKKKNYRLKYARTAWNVGRRCRKVPKIMRKTWLHKKQCGGNTQFYCGGSLTVGNEQGIVCEGADNTKNNKGDRTALTDGVQQHQDVHQKIGIEVLEREKEGCNFPKFENKANLIAVERLGSNNDLEENSGGNLRTTGKVDVRCGVHGSLGEGRLNGDDSCASRSKIDTMASKIDYLTKVSLCLRRIPETDVRADQQVSNISTKELKAEHINKSRELSLKKSKRDKQAKMSVKSESRMKTVQNNSEDAALRKVEQNLVFAEVKKKKVPTATLS